VLRHDILGAPDMTPQPPHRTAYDWLKDFILPLALAAAGIVSHQVLWYLGAAAFVLVAALVGVVPPFLRSVRQWQGRAHDDRLARRNHADFRRLVRALGEFVDPNRSERLEEIVSRRLIEKVPAARGRALIAPQRIFHSMWNLLDRRTTAAPEGIRGALANWDELYTVLNDFEREHVAPVFRNLPPDLRQALDDAAKSDFNAYREQFNAFCNGYREQARQFFSSLKSVRREPPYFEHIKPLL
jgi:hypothetical protein